MCITLINKLPNHNPRKDGYHELRRIEIPDRKKLHRKQIDKIDHMDTMGEKSVSSTKPKGQNMDTQNNEIEFKETPAPILDIAVRDQKVIVTLGEGLTMSDAAILFFDSLQAILPNWIEEAGYIPAPKT